ncbi:MAG: ArsC/Spx/MgsR family protein [Arcobacteraceae bacterium]|jgi:nitrogenase-associated protein|nr:ArsC/Spx/MgsR family protein [Arcobacteraceae bacterium]
MKIIFYEKPNCAGNAKQKKLLTLNGISYETRSILDTPWNQTLLNSFFEGLDTKDMINNFAPKIKNNEIEITTISKNELIELMMQEPILIKRPLLEIGETKICGFDIKKINQILHTNICENISISTCQSGSQCTNVL